LPKYAGMRYSDIWDLQPSYHDLWVGWYGEAIRCTVWFGHARERKCFFIESHSAENFFGRDRLYGYGDDAERFAFIPRPRSNSCAPRASGLTSFTATTGRPG
jgi:starch synthase